MAAKTTVHIPYGNNVFKAYANGSYRRDADRPLTSYNRMYGPQSSESETGENILQDKDYISKAYTLNAGAIYNLFIWPYQRTRGHYVLVVPRFDFLRNHSDQSQSLWHQRQEITDISGSSIVPPSTIRREWLTLDANNTYNSILTQGNYKSGVEMNYIFLPNLKGGTQYNLVLAMHGDLRHEHLQYQQAGA